MEEETIIVEEPVIETPITESEEGKTSEETMTGGGGAIE